MLKVKKISKRKLAAYTVFIAIMFLGTMFFIYKNYKLSSQSQVLTELIDENEEPVITPVIKKDNIDSVIENNKILLREFKKNNYNNLINNQVEPKAVEPGNPNLFEYYEEVR